MKKHERIYIEVLVLVILFVLVLAFPVKAETLDTVTNLDGQSNEELDEIIDRLDNLQNTMPGNEYNDLVLEFLRYLAENQYSRDEKQLIHDELFECMKNMTVSVNGLDTLSQNIVVTLSGNVVSANTVSANTVSANDIASIKNDVSELKYYLLALVILSAFNIGQSMAGKVVNLIKW